VKRIREADYRKVREEVELKKPEIIAKAQTGPQRGAPPATGRDHAKTQSRPQSQSSKLR